MWTTCMPPNISWDVWSGMPVCPPCSPFMASRQGCHSAVSLCHSLNPPPPSPPPPPSFSLSNSTLPHSIHHYPPPHGLYPFYCTQPALLSFRKCVFMSFSCILFYLCATSCVVCGFWEALNQPLFLKDNTRGGNMSGDAVVAVGMRTGAALRDRRKCQFRGNILSQTHTHTHMHSHMYSLTHSL